MLLFLALFVLMSIESMKRNIYYLLLILWVFFQPVLASEPVGVIREFIRETYGDRLNISEEQIEQLSWVIDNPVDIHEMVAKAEQKKIHQEVPRALSRLYSLQLLRSGTQDDYQQFIAPQTDSNNPKLNKDSFNQMAELIGSMDAESYEVLQAGAIISAVTLSPKARLKASIILNEKLPQDSVQFLSITMAKAMEIYSLARHIIKKHPSAEGKFEVIFLPDSHLRHMMYNEGSQAMYSSLKKGFANNSIKQNDLDLWYAHWLVNIAGFRGNLAPVGSLYLTQRTYMAMNQVKVSLDKMYRDTKVNPMQVYLQTRSNWLHLSSWTKKTEERQALASLAAMLRLFTPQDGKELFASFRKLSTKDQQQWIAHVEQQMKVLPEPAPTYAPKVFARAIEVAGITETIQKVLPLVINTYTLGQKMRSDGDLGSNIPLSFRELASNASVERILGSEKPLVVDINPENGLATLK